MIYSLALAIIFPLFVCKRKQCKMPERPLFGLSGDEWKCLFILDHLLAILVVSSGDGREQFYFYSQLSPVTAIGIVGNLVRPQLYHETSTTELQINGKDYTLRMMPNECSFQCAQSIINLQRKCGSLLSLDNSQVLQAIHGMNEIAASSRRTVLCLHYR